MSLPEEYFLRAFCKICIRKVVTSIKFTYLSILHSIIFGLTFFFLYIGGGDVVRTWDLLSGEEYLYHCATILSHWLNSGNSPQNIPIIYSSLKIPKKWFSIFYTHKLKLCVLNWYATTKQG